MFKSAETSAKEEHIIVDLSDLALDPLFPKRDKSMDPKISKDANISEPIHQENSKIECENISVKNAVGDVNNCKSEENQTLQKIPGKKSLIEDLGLNLEDIKRRPHRESNTDENANDWFFLPNSNLNPKNEKEKAQSKKPPEKSSRLNHQTLHTKLDKTETAQPKRQVKLVDKHKIQNNLNNQASKTSNKLQANGFNLDQKTINHVPSNIKNYPYLQSKKHCFFTGQAQNPQINQNPHFSQNNRKVQNIGNNFNNSYYSNHDNSIYSISATNSFNSTSNSNNCNLNNSQSNGFDSIIGAITKQTNKGHQKRGIINIEEAIAVRERQHCLEPLDLKILKGKINYFLSKLDSNPLADFYSNSFSDNIISKHVFTGHKLRLNFIKSFVKNKKFSTALNPSNILTSRIDAVLGKVKMSDITHKYLYFVRTSNSRLWVTENILKKKLKGVIGNVSEVDEVDLLEQELSGFD